MKEAILDYSEQLVQSRGMEALSFQQIATAVGLSKASVFHHFKNTEALGLALVDRCGTKYGLEYSRIVSSQATAPQKLRKIAKSFHEGLMQNRLCLLAALGSSQPTLSEPIQDALGQAAKNAVNIFVQIFDQGQNDGSLKFEGTSTSAAQVFLALLQGLQQLSRYGKDFSIFEQGIECYIRSTELDK